MISQIDLELCNGCGRCADVCPMDVLRVDVMTHKPAVRYPEDCMTCFACEEICPVKCILVGPFRVPTPLLSHRHEEPRHD